MAKFLELLNGNKSYIVIVLGAVGALLQAKGIAIPDYAWQLLALAGLGAVRSAVKKFEIKK